MLGLGCCHPSPYHLQSPITTSAGIAEGRKESTLLQRPAQSGYIHQLATRPSDPTVWPCFCTDTPPRHPAQTPKCLSVPWVVLLLRYGCCVVPSPVPSRRRRCAALRCCGVWSLRTTPFKRRLLPIHSATPLPLHPHSRLTGQRQGKVSCSRVVVRFVVFGQLKSDSTYSAGRSAPVAFVSTRK
jgi:hypothetical protein